VLDKELPGEGTMAIGPGLAVVVSLQPTKPVAVVFAASPPATGQGGEATLEAVAFPRPKVDKLLAGITDGVLEASSALSYSLSSGPKRLRLGLSRGMAATLGTETTVESVVATDEDASAETLYTSATTLTLLYTGGGTGRFSIEAIAAAAPVVTASEPFELMLADAGVTRLQVADVGAEPVAAAASSEAAAPTAPDTSEKPASEPSGNPAKAGPATLHVRGAVEEAAFLQADGSLHRGRDLPLQERVRRHGGPGDEPCAANAVQCAHSERRDTRRSPGARRPPHGPAPDSHDTRRACARRESTGRALDRHERFRCRLLPGRGCPR
jgi:hypothetical protein